MWRRLPTVCDVCVIVTALAGSIQADTLEHDSVDADDGEKPRHRAESGDEEAQIARRVQGIHHELVDSGDLRQRKRGVELAKGAAHRGQDTRGNARGSQDDEAGACRENTGGPVDHSFVTCVETHLLHVAHDPDDGKHVGRIAADPAVGLASVARPAGRLNSIAMRAAPG